MQYVICNSFLSEILVCQAEYKTYAWSNDWHVYPKNLKAGSKKSFYILNGQMNGEKLCRLPQFEASTRTEPVFP